MLLEIPEVLGEARVNEARDLLASAEWASGAVTAGFQSVRVKHNLQLPERCEAAWRIGTMIVESLETNLLFMSAALPAHVFPPLLNRYEPGHGFGNHVDNAIRRAPGTTHRIRTDLSATLFLSDPAEYDGGELVIDDTYGPHAVKLKAGHMVLYPGTSLHRVQPITRGVRMAAFFWIQSLVREDAQRTLLFDMDMAIVRLRRQLGDDEQVLALTGIYHNLLRRWAEP